MNDSFFDTLKKAASLVDRTTRGQAVGVAGLVLFGSFLEAAGIGLIFPFIQLILDPARLRDVAWVERVFGPVPAAGEHQFLAFLALGLLGIFVVKNVLLIVVYYVQTRFIVNNEEMLAMRLFRAYLNGAYSLHLSRNSAALINNVIGTVETVFSSVAMAFVTLAAEICLGAGLVVILFVVEPVLTLAAVLVLTAAVATFYGLTRQRLVSWGAQEVRIRTQLINRLQQGFHNIKEIKVLGRERFITQDFAGPRRALSRLKIIINVMGHLPRLWVETTLVVGTLSAVIYVLLGGRAPAEILPTLVLFAAAAIRLIPSMNRIIASLSAVKRGQEALDIVCGDIRIFEENADGVAANDGNTVSFNDVVRVERLSYRYPGAASQALDGVDFTLAKGQSIGLVGPSGSGKSTVVNVILGLLAPSAGRIVVDGVDVVDSIRAWRRRFGYVPQSIYLTDDTLRRNIAFGIADGEIDDEKVWKAVNLSQLEETIRNLPDQLDTFVGEHGVRLSGGQRQRVGIARALYHDPDVLILDEATSSLDNETERELNDAIERLSGKKTLIIIAHRLSTVRRCDRLVLFVDGRVADTGTFSDLVERNARFRRLVELSEL